ncbi:MAG: PDZ domain-containing protein, partial [Pseudomonadota bacterium]
NRGNSGGPLFDMRGNVIGINNAIFSPSGGSVGIGFAIPAEIAEPIVNQLKDGMEIERGFLGVSLGPVTDDLADALGLEANRGEIVQNVQDDSAAQAAGLQAGDIITAINGQDVTSEQTVIFLIANLQPGETVPVEVLRNGETVSLNATLGKRPTEEELRQQAETFDPDSEEPMNPEEMDDVVADRLGLQVLPLTPQIAGRIGVEEDTVGLVIGAVDPNSDAGRKGLRRADIILEANRQTVSNVEELRAQIEATQAEERGAMLLKVQRRGGPARFIAVRLRSE